MNDNQYQLSDFDFDLPKELIAQTPLLNRSDSRLLVLDKNNGSVEDKHFKEIVDFFNPGDAIVVNNSRVLPARLHGFRPETKGAVEVLLLKQIENDRWEVLMKPAKKSPIGSTVIFGDGLLKATIVEELEHGGRIIEFSYQGIFMEILDQLGEMPLPPYIKQKLDDKERYQTVYSKVNGSAAAPTAGLHWTKELLDQVQAKGVNLVELTLHVGLGTFRPVEEEDINQHQMHSEFYQIDQAAVDVLNQTRNSGKKIIATGTTSVRTLETIGQKFEKSDLQPSSGWTDIFIKPGYDWQIVNGIITNFHLPKSTLIMLVSAFAGYQNTINAYQHAVANRYRFFSFGDAMLIL